MSDVNSISHQKQKENNNEDRITISPTDFKLRLFIDTNVLIDYIEECNKNNAKDFLDIFKDLKTRPINNEVVISDYVIWELYGYLRTDIYIRKMMTDPDKKWGFKRSLMYSREFKEAESGVMEEIGNKIKKVKEEIEQFIYITNIMSKEAEGFSELVESLLQCSKFEYKDAMVFASAFHRITHSNILITNDERFRREGSRIKQLEYALKSLHKSFQEKKFKFKVPTDFCSKEKINKTYEEWFNDYFEDKAIGKVIKQWNEVKVIGIECSDSNSLKINDYVYIIKMNTNFDAFKKPLVVKIEKENIRDFDCEKTVEEGNKITIKLPFELNQNLEGASIFLSSDY